MSDLFHERVPDAFIDDVFDVMDRAHWHVFQLLTKRADRLAAYGAGREWPPNVWAGVSVESVRYMPRIEYLRQIASFPLNRFSARCMPCPWRRLTG